MNPICLSENHVFICFTASTVFASAPRTQNQNDLEPKQNARAETYLPKLLWIWWEKEDIVCVKMLMRNVTIIIDFVQTMY